MIRTLFFLASFFFAKAVFAQSVGVGTTTPNAGAVLDISSANKAMIIPRLTTAAIESLTPVAGMLVYNTDMQVFCGYSSGGSLEVLSQKFADQGISLLNNQVGQSFRVTKDMLLDSIGVPLEAFGQGAFCRIELYSGFYTFNSTYITTGNAMVTASKTVFFPFRDQRVILKEGQDYTFVVSHNPGAATVTDYVGIYYSSTNQFPKGSMYIQNQFSSVKDLYFIIKQGVLAGWKELSH